MAKKKTTTEATTTAATRDTNNDDGRRRLTPGNVGRFAAAAAEEDPLSDRELLLEVFLGLLEVVPQRYKDAAVRNFIRKAEHFRRADAPGHQPWYSHHLQVAARAVELFRGEGGQVEAPPEGE